MTSLRFLYCYCKFLADFTYSSGVFVVDFEQVNAGWDDCLFVEDTPPPSEENLKPAFLFFLQMIPVLNYFFANDTYL